MKASQRERYDEWELQVANQRIDDKKWVEQVANQTEKSIDSRIQVAIASNNIKKERLKSQIESIQKINGVPTPDIRELQKTAGNIPELQWVDPAKIKDGTYNNILLADYYVTHAKDIASKVTPRDAILFQNSINNLSDTLLRPRIAEFEKLTSTLVLGSARDTINEKWASLIKEGYSKSVIWDPRDRTISFQNERWDIKILETASIPPRESVEKNWLRIGRDIARVSPEQSEKQDLQIKSEKLTGIVAKDSNSVKLSSSESIPGSMQEKNWDKIKAYNVAKVAFESATNPTEKLTALKNLREQNHILEDTRRNSITAENLADPKYEKLEKELFDELYGLNQLDASLGQYIQNNAKLQKYNNIDTPLVDTFDTDAQESLRLLSSLGFDELGQSGFEEVMTAWNTHYKSDASYQIRLDESAKIDDIQEKKLREFASNFDKKSGTPSQKFQQLRGIELKNNEFISSTWNNVASRAKYLFEKTETSPSTK